VQKIDFYFSIGLLATTATKATTMNAQQIGLDKKIDMVYADECDCKQATMNAQQIKEFKTALRICSTLECPVHPDATEDDWDEYHMIYDNANQLLWKHAPAVMKSRDCNFSDFKIVFELRDLKLKMGAWAADCDKAWNGVAFVDFDEAEDEDRDRFCADCGKAFVEDITCFMQNWYSTKCATCTGQAFTCEVCNEEKDWKEQLPSNDEDEGQDVESLYGVCIICKQCAEDTLNGTLKEYKCRVECPADVERMRARLEVGEGVLVCDWMGGEWVFKDRRTLETIRKLIGECVDCHVAEQTIQPIADYTGVRA